MKLKRDAITGIVGLSWSLIWFILIQTQTKVPKKLLEPGPRLLPYVALVVVGVSSLMLLIKGLRDWKRDPKPDKPYFPKGGVLKVTKSYLMLVATAIGMAIFGFLITATGDCGAVSHVRCRIPGQAAHGRTLRLREET